MEYGSHQRERRRPFSTHSADNVLKRASACLPFSSGQRGVHPSRLTKKEMSYEEKDAGRSSAERFCSSL